MYLYSILPPAGKVSVRVVDQCVLVLLRDSGIAFAVSQEDKEVVFPVM